MTEILEKDIPLNHKEPQETCDEYIEINLVPLKDIVLEGCGRFVCRKSRKKTTQEACIIQVIVWIYLFQWSNWIMFCILVDFYMTMY